MTLLGGAGISAAGLHHGPGVLRRVATIAELQQDPRWIEGLAPLAGGMDPVTGIAPRVPGDMRIGLLNIRMNVPPEFALDPANESIAAMRDVARFVRATNPDVLLLQEVRVRPYAPGQAGLSDSLSALAHLVGATDVAFTPAITGDPVTGTLRHYGTAALTRNDFRIERSSNMVLDNFADLFEQRSSGVYSIASPDGKHRATVFGTHLTNEPTVEEQVLRFVQLDTIKGAANSVRTTGSFAYHDALDGSRQVGTGYARERVMIAGDFNQERLPSDVAMNEAGFENVTDVLARTGPAGRARAEAVSALPTSFPPDKPPHGIDHAYVNGMPVREVGIARVPRHELPAGEPTDHAGTIIDVPR